MLEKLLRIAAKRRWWLVLPTVVFALGACAVSRVLPNRYTSEAAILVEHPQVPAQYVTPNSTSDMRETLLITTDAILSRTQLLQIINEFNLYPKERKRLSPEELVALMHDKISIKALDNATGGNSLNAFKISYTGSSPHLAQDVTSKLTTLFIQENDRSREEQDNGTTNFLAEQVQSAGDRLKQLEARVTDFKMRNLGALPEQQEGNLSILSGLQMQLQNTQAAEGRAREQQVYLQSLLANYRELPPAMVVTPGAPGGVAADPVTALKARLADLRSDRAGLLARYTDKYPDVAKIDEEIKSTEAALAAAEKRAAQNAAEPTGKGNTETADASANNATTAQVKSQLASNRLEIQNDEAQERQLQGQIAEYRNRLNMTPVREQELAELNRNYELSKKNYDDLLNRKNQSELATSLDKHQKGQQFHIIDKPSLPMKPASPNHAAIALGGLAAGLALGVALVFLLETKDHSLINEKDLSRLFTFPLMVGLPSLSTKAEIRRRSKLQKLEWFAGVVLCLMVCATEFYIYRRG
jgi:polysaccharide chain length determinant protein (PEP-CTERM system associated)